MNPKTKLNERGTSDEETVDELLADLQSLIDASRQTRRPTDVEKNMESARFPAVDRVRLADRPPDERVPRSSKSGQDTIEWDAEETDERVLAVASAGDLIPPEVLFSDQDDDHN